MANLLNNHFTSINSPEPEQWDPQTGCEHNIATNDEETSFAFTEITYEEVSKILCALSPSKSCGVDGLTAGLISNYKEYFPCTTISFLKGSSRH